MSEQVLYGMRIPKDYFVALGAGETDSGPGVDPWETGSYDIALQQAGIENFNIVKYTSVMPPEATRHAIEDVRHLFHHGAVLETIMAQVNGRQGDHLCAGVGILQVRRKVDGVHIGGFACEYEGNASKDGAIQVLEQSLVGLFNRRYDTAHYEYFGVETFVQDLVVQKKFATVLAAICFVTYVFPEVTL